MSREERVLEALGQLRAAMREQSAAPRVEAEVLAAFRSAKARRERSRPWWGWALGAGAAAAAVALPFVLSLEVQVPAEPPAVVAQMPVARLELTRRPPSAVQGVQVARSSRPERRVRRAPERDELATEFLPIPAAPPLSVTEDAQLVRVRVPAASMRSFGFPVSEERAAERISADLLLGGDGVARAVRFVKTAY